MKKRYGFTLAEVLITLGIIGVVAAMTIPTLMSNTNSAKFRSQFKKSISTLNQAGLMAQAQYDIDYGTRAAGTEASPVTACATNASPTDGNDSSICAIFNGTLTGHTITSGLPEGYSETNITNGIPAGDKMTLTMADGSMLVFNGKAAGCTKDIGSTLSSTTPPAACQGYIDVNGVTLPNKEVKCQTENSTAVGNGTCNVPADAAHMTDVFPVVFHDGTVEPLTNAARYVLTTAK